MLKTIAELWNGALEPIRYLGVNNSQIKQLDKLIQSNSERLKENLSETAKEIFKKYDDCITEYISILSEQAFCEGFCLGTKITSEALTYGEEII